MATSNVQKTEIERATTTGRKVLENVTNHCLLHDELKTPGVFNRGNEVEERNRTILSLCSRLSCLTQEVDKLVSKAIKSPPKGNQSRKQIDSFSIFLTDIIASLEPWIPRLNEIVKSDDNEEHIPLQSTAKAIRRDLEVESMVSPSPLVSWKGNKKFEQGKQLFLLTPLPPSVKTIKPSKLTVERLPPMSLPRISEHTQNNVLQISPAPHEQMPTVSKTTGKCPDDRSLILITPLKQFPRTGRKCTPYRVPDTFLDSSSSSSESSEKLHLKYPELLGIMQAYFPSKAGKNADSSHLKATIPVFEDVPTGVIQDTSLTNENWESTLKKELWEKFEAASKGCFCIKPRGKKGFMELLDEVSTNESSDL